MPPPQQQRLPLEGSIEQGTVSRVETYGAFVDLPKYYRVRGLIHISQLAKFKVDRVEDVVAVDDSVWVKVLQVTESQDEQGRTRVKVSLSLKDVSQDGTETDLGAQAAHHQAVSQQIQQNLQSSIGMGVAMDPMANLQPRNSDRLILKHQPKKHETVINGYALVDDEEGELPKPPQSSPPQLQQQQQRGENPTVSAAANLPPTAVIARGRGRGTTLPAWMTRQQPEGGLAKQTANLEEEEAGSDRKKHAKRKHNGAEDEDKEEIRTKKHRKQPKEEKTSRKHKDKKKHKHKHKHHHHRRRSTSRSISSSSDRSEDRRRSRRDRSSSRDRNRKQRRTRSREDASGSSSESSRDHHRHSRRRRENKGDDDDDDVDRKGHHKSSSSQPFHSVEDAQKLIEQLEAKKQKRERERG